MIEDRILKSVKDIPAFPPTVFKIMNMIDDPDYSVATVVDVIKYDQAIAANLLRICNSAYFGIRKRVESLRDAVVFMGQKNIVRAVQTAGISKYYEKSSGYGMKASKLWEHSVGVALMSQILSKRIFHNEDDILYTAALLHDIGKIILGEFVDESFKKIIDMVLYKGNSFLEAEEAVIGTNHAELGGLIATHWNFPEDVKDVIAYHHRPDLIPNKKNDHVWLIHLADQSCLMMGVGLGSDGLAYRSVTEVIKRYNLRLRDIEECIVLLFEELERAKELINIV